MKTKKCMIILIPAVLITAFMFIAGCATSGKAYHKYIMRGQVLELSGKEAYLCIGSRDGAQVGQELAVYQNIPVRSVNPPVQGTQIYFKRERIGTVRITAIVDEHYARAEIVSGRADKNATVELEPTIE